MAHYKACLWVCLRVPKAFPDCIKESLLFWVVSLLFSSKALQSQLRIWRTEVAATDVII